MKIAAISIADYVEAVEGLPHDAERLFMRMLLKMYSREDGLPDSDAENAAMFGYKSVRPYRRLKQILLASHCGIYIDDETIRHERVEHEVEAVKLRKQRDRENGRKGGRPKKFEESLDEVCPKFAPNLGETFSKQPPVNCDKSITYENPSPSPSPTEERKKDASSAREIPGLNGHTSMYVSWLAGWLTNGFYDPEPNEAFEILSGNVKAYGHEKVESGMLDLKAQIASGKNFPNLASSFSGFIKHAKPAPKARVGGKVDARQLEELYDEH